MMTKLLTNVYEKRLEGTKICLALAGIDNYRIDVAKDKDNQIIPDYVGIYIKEEDKEKENTFFLASANMHIEIFKKWKEKGFDLPNDARSKVYYNMPIEEVIKLERGMRSIQ